MSNRYSLSQTDSPLTTYRVIDHSRDDGEPALHPSTLPSGAPHPLAGRPAGTIRPRASLPRNLGGCGPGPGPRGLRRRRHRAGPGVGGGPAGAVLRGDPHALDGIPDDMGYPPTGGLEVLQWFAVPTSWDPVPADRRPALGPGSVHPHQQRRWQDRYAVAAAHASSASLALRYLVSSL